MRLVSLTDEKVRLEKMQASKQHKMGNSESELSYWNIFVEAEPQSI